LSFKKYWKWKTDVVVEYTVNMVVEKSFACNSPLVSSKSKHGGISTGIQIEADIGK
jgi:hypothetical protein